MIHSAQQRILHLYPLVHMVIIIDKCYNANLKIEEKDEQHPFFCVIVTKYI